MSSVATPSTPAAGRVAHFLTGRRSAWLVIALFLVVVGALSGALSRVDTAPRGTNLPVGSESALVAEKLATFSDASMTPALVVATRTDGGALDQQQRAQFLEFARQIGAGEKPGIIPSEDSRAVLTMVPLTSTDDDAQTNEQVKALRDKVAAATPDGLTIKVTGGPAFGADIANSFAGADVTLLLVTVGIVAVLLLLTYRSPVLWLVPLVVVALADQTAAQVSNWLSVTTGWHAEGGIVSVLVFGAGTNYALLLISRYREELTRHDDHRAALATAWRASLPAILASNLTVVLALLTLLVASLPDTRGLGLSSAVGLLLALAAVVFALPAVLAVTGRRIFWPFIPRADQGAASLDQPGWWGRVANAVVTRPVRALAAGLALLAVMATGLFGLTVGLSQADQFRVKAESVDGLAVVAEHYPAGLTAPTIVLTNALQSTDVSEKIAAVPGVERVLPAGSPGHGLVRLQVTGTPGPGTPEALQLVRDVRAAVHQVPGADAQVGGSVAQDLDIREAQARNFWTIAPLILLVILVVLAVLTRSALAPVLLLGINLVSTAAAIGAGAVLSRWILGSPALAVETPLFAFLFLVALGIDYTIFLVERTRHEAQQHGTRQGMVEAVRHTGAVITSAGIVLAAVFAALGVLPLVVMGQLGIIVGLGVLVDTLVVRTIVVPAVVGLIGDRLWWPRRHA